MLEEALAYPTSGEQSLGRILVGGILVFFSWLIVPGLAVYGYYVRVLEATSRGEEEAPAFEDWGELVVDGLKAAVIGFAYAIVPYVLFLVVGGLFGASAGMGEGGGASGALAGLGLVTLLLGLVLAFVVSYVTPAAITNFAREGRISAAFDFSTLKTVLVSNSYVLAVVLVFALAVAVWFLFAAVALFTFGLGLLIILPLLPFFYFWLYLVGAYMFGTAFGEAVGEGEDGAATAAAAAR